jgi:death on curing protein
VKVPVFLDERIVYGLHRESLRRFGGAEGVRDARLVQSAVGAVLNSYYYGGDDLFGIAASYAFHIAQAQAFLDGNKRTAAAARCFS